MEYSGAGGKLIHVKNQKQKISWHCPFKLLSRNNITPSSPCPLLIIMLCVYLPLLTIHLITRTPRYLWHNLNASTLTVSNYDYLCSSHFILSSQRSQIFVRILDNKNHDVKPNPWTYNFFDVSGHNLESSQTWGFRMDFLNHRVGGVVFLLSHLHSTIYSNGLKNL